MSPNALHMQDLQLHATFQSDFSQSHAGAVAGVVPFAIGAYEFGKRIVSGCIHALLPAAACQ